MNEKLICTIFGLLCSLAIMGQSIHDSKLKHDNQFRPYVEISVTNDSFTEITSIDFGIVYSWKNVGRIFLTKDPRRNTTRDQIVEIIIPAMSKKRIQFYIPMVDNYEPYSINLNRVRYYDGKVKKVK
mgnify:FL=1